MRRMAIYFKMRLIELTSMILILKHSQFQEQGQFLQVMKLLIMIILINRKIKSLKFN